MAARRSKGSETPEAIVDKCEKLGRPSGRELAAYAATVAAALLYFAYEFFISFGQHPREALPVPLLKPGWLAKFRDGTEDAVLAKMRRSWRFLLLTTAGYLAVSRISLHFASATLHHVSCACCTLALTVVILGHRATALLLSLHLATVAAGACSLLAVWALVLSAMFLQNWWPPLLSDSLSMSGQQQLMFYPISGYLYCRLLSLGHCLRLRCGHSAGDLIDRLRLAGRQLPLSLHYVFYLPYHYVGPILTFDQFEAAVASPSRRRLSSSDVVWAAQRSLRLAVWLLVLEAIGHCLPVGAFLSGLGRRPAYRHLAFAMYLHGQSFMLTYLQLYGWPAVAARLDGVQLPDWPECISRVYTYSRMWRVFDRGLFAVLRQHVYEPLGGGRFGRARRLAAVAATFAFVAVYHGDTPSMRAWAALNAGQLMLEAAVVRLYRAHVGAAVAKYLPPWLQQRLVAYIVSWNLLASCCTIHFFFFEGRGTEFTMQLIVRRITLQEPLWPLLVLSSLAYCFVQLGMAYQHRVDKKAE